MASGDQFSDFHKLRTGYQALVNFSRGSEEFGTSMSPSGNRVCARLPNYGSNLEVGSQRGIPPFEPLQTPFGSRNITGSGAPTGFIRRIEGTDPDFEADHRRFRDEFMRNLQAPQPLQGPNNSTNPFTDREYAPPMSTDGTMPGNSRGMPPPGLSPPPTDSANPYSSAYGEQHDLTREYTKAIYGTDKTGFRSGDCFFSSLSNSLKLMPIPALPMICVVYVNGITAAGTYASGLPLWHYGPSAYACSGDLTSRPELKLSSRPDHNDTSDEEGPGNDDAASGDETESAVREAEDNAFYRPDNVYSDRSVESNGLSDSAEMQRQTDVPEGDKKSRNSRRKSNTRARGQARSNTSENDPYEGLISRRQVLATTVSASIPAPYRRLNAQPESQNLSKKAHRSALLLTAPKWNHKG
ncbi:hypothetical protein I302_107078 [Kwoniella bestiolae CBS 10118]|uniref:Uncharacterized protein n=1 Tax=Kwoniella bestiolae CBS 10118 TaxID=1296100 RepID=A0A1B9FZJ7_9TREE|nr:hypothetical protein I302_05657 [Kwoniella bestiolae CBS 10118]OCF24198.1 hypothetical protein I302_05657 [Kwoniella bestiolae CBS 10118]